MCTLTIAFKVFERFPLAVAANRDEFYVRPSLPPALRTGPPMVFCPLDAKAGGTWIGVNEHGVFAGITNISGIRPPDPTVASRGAVIMEALKQADATTAADAAKRTAISGRRNPFQAVICDGKDAFLLRYIDTVELTPLAGGVHVLSNWDALDDVARSKGDVIKKLMQPLNTASKAEEIVPLFKRLLSDHSGDDWQKSICVHIEGYGTMFSLVYLMGGDRRESVWESAEGHPCEHGFADLSGMMKNGLGWADCRTD